MADLLAMGRLLKEGCSVGQSAHAPARGAQHVGGAVCRFSCMQPSAAALAGGARQRRCVAERSAGLFPWRSLKEGSCCNSYKCGT